MSMNSKSIENLNSFSFFMLTSCIILIVLFLGCGVKGPPVPPSAKAPEAIKDLTYNLNNNTVTLTWTIPQHKKTWDRKESSSNLLRFYVYKAKEPLSEKMCSNCPILFKRIADFIPTKKDIDKGKAFFSQDVKKGFKYYYKIVTVAANGMISKDSNFIEFIHSSLR